MADGTMMHHPRCYRNAERRLKTAQHTGARRKKGSTRRRKAVQVLAKAHQQVKRQRQRQRQDFQHQAALALVRAYDTSYHENLQTANMRKNHHLAKSIADSGWSTFLSILSHKAACAGRSVVAVNPAYTSQTCSGCGAGVKKGLSVRWHRWHTCPDCGMWNQPAQRPQRRQEQRAAWAKPSGSRGVGCVGEPRIHRALARVECQRSIILHANTPFLADNNRPLPEMRKGQR